MTALPHTPHPVTAAVAGARTGLAEVAETQLWSMTDDEAANTLAEVENLATQVEELRLRTLARLDRSEVAAASAAPNTSAWYAARHQIGLRTARRDVWLAGRLDVHETTRAAMTAGLVSAEQARVIVATIAELPSDLEPDVLTRAEEHLVAEAAHHDPARLRILGRRILELVAPDVADAHEAAILEREERAAAATTRLTYWDDGHGGLQGRFAVGDVVTAAMFKKALLAFASRKHRAAKGPLGEPKPTPQLLGEAFAEMIQRFPVKKLPRAGGLNATVVVLMPLDTLMGGLKAAHLDTGEAISPGAARQLACESLIIPAVLGGKSEVLDLGRGRRFHSSPQRLKARIEHRGCAVDGCDRRGIHMHHPTRWADGGTTDSDGIPLCPWHHHRAHDSRYRMTRLSTGTFTFHRRT